MFDSIAFMLDAHGLTGAVEAAFPHTGFSGAALTRLTRGDGRAFVLKRMSIDRDWIMRATDDTECREAAFADATVDLGALVRSPSVAVARDGDAHALLMRDISPEVLPQGPITDDQLAAIVRGMAALHAEPPPAHVPWCDLTRRLMLLTPATARIAESYRAPVARQIIDGWSRFEEHASLGARSIVRRLIDDPSPLVRALNRAPAGFLHGDLKFDNIGIDASEHLWLIDWAMPLVAPPAVELGWFLAINSQRLPASVSLDDVMAGYAEAARLRGEARELHDALTVICGLLLRGWRKALDASAGDLAELRWWCERVESAAEALG